MSSKEEQIRRLNELKAAESEEQKKGEAKVQELAKGDKEVRQFLEASQIHKKEATGLRSLVGARNFSEELNCINELIQNVDDLSYSDRRPELEITLRQCRERGRLTIEFWSNEDGFTKENVEAICSYARSTKEKDPDSTGEKGIGFKSVFALCESVEIHSRGYHFEFKKEPEEEQARPHWIKDKDRWFEGTGTKTILVLPSNVEEKTIAKQVDSRISGSLLSFLRKVKKISFKHESVRGVKQKVIERQDKKSCIELTKDFLSWYELSSESFKFSNLRMATREITEQHEINTEKESTKTLRWLLISGRIDEPGLERKRREISEQDLEVEVAIPLDQAGAHETGGLYTQMPVKALASSPIKINAQFELITNREDIATDSRLNESILATAGELCAVGTCALIHADECSWSYAFKNFKKEEAPNLLKCWESMHKCIQMSPCIPTSSGRYVLPKQALRVKNNKLHSLIEVSVRQQLYNKDFAHADTLNSLNHLENIDEYSWTHFLKYASSLDDSSCEYPDNQKDFFEALRIESTFGNKAARLKNIQALKIVRGADGELRKPTAVVLGISNNNSSTINRYITFCNRDLFEMCDECDQLKSFLLVDLGLIPNEPEELLDRVQNRLLKEAEPNYQNRLCVLDYLHSIEGICKKEKYDKLFRDQVKVLCIDGIWRNVNEAYAPFPVDGKCNEKIFSHVKCYAEKLQICASVTDGRNNWDSFLIDLGAKTSLKVSIDGQLTEEFQRFVSNSDPSEKTEWLTWALGNSECSKHDWKALCSSGMQNWLVEAKDIDGVTLDSELYNCKLNTPENQVEFKELSLYIGYESIGSSDNTGHLDDILLFTEPNAHSCWLSLQAMLLGNREIDVKKYNRLIQLCVQYFHDEFHYWSEGLDVEEIGELVDAVDELLNTKSKLLAEVAHAGTDSEPTLDCCLLDTILIKSKAYFDSHVHSLLDVGLIDPATKNQKDIPKDSFEKFLAGLGLKKYAHPDKVCDAINLLKAKTDANTDAVRSSASKLFRQLEANEEKEGIYAPQNSVFIPGSDGHWYEPSQAQESTVLFWHSDSSIQDIIRSVEDSPFTSVNLDGTLHDYLSSTWDIPTLDTCVMEEVSNISTFETMTFEQAFGPDCLEQYTRSALECFYYEYRKKNKNSTEKACIISLQDQLKKLVKEDIGIFKLNVHVCHGPVIIRYMKKEKNRYEEITNFEFPVKELQGEWYISGDSSEPHPLAIILQEAFGLSELYSVQIHNNAIGSKIKFRVDLPDEIMTEVVGLGHEILDNEVTYEQTVINRSSSKSHNQQKTLPTKNDLDALEKKPMGISVNKAHAESNPGPEKNKNHADHMPKSDFDTVKITSDTHEGDSLPHLQEATLERDAKTTPEPPIRPKSPTLKASSGHSNQKRKSRPKPRQLTAVAIPKLNISEKHEQQKKIDEVDRAAIKVAMNFEQNNGRRPVEMPHSNKGYDIKSESNTEETRYIEVKGTSGHWSCVQVSISQFKFSQENRNTWLYVVENALEPHLETIIHVIPSFDAKLEYLQLGSEWITCSTESTNGPKFESGHIDPQNLEVGAVYNDDEIIEKIEASGEITRLTLKHRQTQDLRSINIASPSEG